MVDVTSYQKNGYAFPIDALTPSETLAARAGFDRLEAEMGPEQAAIGVAGRHRDLPFIWRLASHPRVLDAVEAVIGPDVVLIGTHFFCKYPEPADASPDAGRYVAWHQDVTYWGLEPPQATTAWLAIDDADLANGCMRAIPGSHQLGLLHHGHADRPGNLLSVNQAIQDDRIDPNQAVDLPLRAGQLSLHDGLLVHGSNPNRSNRRRCGLTLRYVTPEVRFVEEPNRRATWMATLLRGEDRFGRLRLHEPPAFATSSPG